MNRLIQVLHSITGIDKTTIAFMLLYTGSSSIVALPFLAFNCLYYLIGWAVGFINLVVVHIWIDFKSRQD